MKCANCQKVFKAQLQPATAQATSPQAAQKAAPKSVPVDTSGQTSSQAKLFPGVIPAGPDPLANHVVTDPGFVDVDLEEIRRIREDEERSKNRFKADDPLAKFKREQKEKREAEKLQKETTKKGLRAGLIGAIVYLFVVIVAAVLALYFEWGFYVLLATGVIGALFAFLTDLMMIQHVKEHDPEQYAYYTFLPPYRIYYWYVNWKDLMGYVIIEIAVSIPLAVNAVLLWYFDDKWGMGWFGD